METDIELIPSLLRDSKSNLINPSRNQFLMDTIFLKENIYLICEWRRLKTFDRKCEKYQQWQHPGTKDRLHRIVTEHLRYYFLGYLFLYILLNILTVSFSMFVSLFRLSWSDCCDPNTQVLLWNIVTERLRGCTQCWPLIGQLTLILASDWLRGLRGLSHRHSDNLAAAVTTTGHLSPLIIIITNIPICCCRGRGFNKTFCLCIAVAVIQNIPIIFITIFIRSLQRNCLIDGFLQTFSTKKVEYYF